MYVHLRVVCSAVCARTKLLLLSMLSQGRDSLERVYNFEVHREIYKKKNTNTIYFEN